MTADNALVRLRNIVKIYGEHAVLKGVDFDLQPGEIHCLVGENGAGKSTLIKIISGAVSPESGEIWVLGKHIRSLNPRQAIELGISTVYQDTEIVDSLTVAENIFLGDEISSNLSLKVDSTKQVEESRRIFERLGVDIDPAEIAGSLSPAEKQIVQIAKALRRNTKVLIMDEPTSSLGFEETRTLLNLLKSLRNQGLGIIYISHYLQEILEVADRITVLKDGEKVGTYHAGEISLDEVVRKMVGRDSTLFFQRRKVQTGGIRLQVRGLTKKGVVENVSFEVRAGEIFGIGGLVGSGRTEMVSLLFGVEKPDAGEVILNGVRIKPRSPFEAMKAGICLVPEDRKKYGIFPGRNIVENLTVVMHRLSRNFVLSPNQEVKVASEMVNRLSMAVSSRDQLVEELSGGNQQKVVIGKWLLNLDASVYIFDEPTKGVDVGARQEIYEIMLELAEKGKSIIMVSSDMPELLSLSDRIGVMRNGRMCCIVKNENLREEDLIRLFLGV